MHNLFTPVQVVKSPSNSYSRQALLRFQQELYAITQPRIISLADERKKIAAWIRGLPQIQRQHVAVFHSVQFTCLLGKLYKEWLCNTELKKYSFSQHNGVYYVQSQRSFRDCRQLEKRLFDNVLLVSKGQLYESITLSDTLLKDSEALFDLLDELQGGVMGCLGEFSTKELQTGEINFQTLYENDAKQLGVWVGALIMRQIALSHILGTKTIEPLCANHKNQERQYYNLWKELQRQIKHNIIKSSFSRSFEEIIKEYMFSVHVARDFLPPIYIQGEEQVHVQFWTDISPKDLFNRLTYTPLAESYTLFGMYRIEIILQIQSKLSEINKANKNKKNKLKKKKKKQLQNSAKCLKQNIIQNRDQVVVSCKVQSNQKQQKQQLTQINVNIQVKDNQIQSKITVEHEILSKQHHNQQIFIKNNTFSLNTIYENQTINNNIILEKSRNQQLQSLFSKTKEDPRTRYRKLILNRLIFVFEKMGLGCRPYGSYVSHLSLPDSDLDISVDSSILNYFEIQKITYREQIVFALQYLIDILKWYPWISDFRLLNKAKIPLLTFSADASLYFDIGSEQKFKLKVNSKKVDPMKSKIIVDLTVQPFANTPQLPHCGLQSTESLKTWIKIYPILQKMIILLKLRLRQADLNKTYQGGIGSYALSLLSIAFVRSVDQLPDTIEKALQQFSVFLKQFQLFQWTIDPQGEIPLIKQNSFKGPILKHPFDGHNLMQKCTKLCQAVEAISEWSYLLKQTL